MKLSLFLRHLRAQDDVGKQIFISMGYTQLELGTAVHFLRLDFALYRHLITPTWTTHLWEFLSLSKIEIWAATTEPVWLPSLPRVDDSFLIHHIQRSGLSHSDQHVLNEWRIYLRVLTVTDMATSSGTKISPDIFYGWRSDERSSILTWPIASRPHVDLLPLWQSFLLASLYHLERRYGVHWGIGSLRCHTTSLGTIG